MNFNTIVNFSFVVIVLLDMNFNTIVNFSFVVIILCSYPENNWNLYCRCFLQVILHLLLFAAAVISYVILCYALYSMPALISFKFFNKISFLIISSMCVCVWCYTFGFILYLFYIDLQPLRHGWSSTFRDNPGIWLIKHTQNLWVLNSLLYSLFFIFYFLMYTILSWDGSSFYCNWHAVQ